MHVRFGEGPRETSPRKRQRRPWPTLRLSLDQKQGEHLFNVIDARYERASTVITTNRAFKDLGKIFHDMVTARGIIDRLVHHSDVIKIEGTSYRLKDRKTLSLAESD